MKIRPIALVVSIPILILAIFYIAKMLAPREPRAPGVTSLYGFLFAVDTGTGRELYFVAQLYDDIAKTPYYKVFTEGQVKEMTGLPDIYPLTKQTLLTAEEARGLVKSGIGEKISSLLDAYENYTFKGCVEQCMSPCKFAPRRACPDISGLIIGEMPSDLREPFEINGTHINATVYCEAYGEMGDYDFVSARVGETCLECCFDEGCTNRIEFCEFFEEIRDCSRQCDEYAKGLLREADCLESIVQGEHVIKYGDDRRPDQWIIFLYRNNTYYGWWIIHDEHKTEVSSCTHCDQETCKPLFHYGESEQALLRYMEENDIEGLIVESFLFQYYVRDLDAFRRALQ